MISQSVPRAKISTHLINPVLPEAKEFLHVFYSHSLFLYLVLRDRRKVLGEWGVRGSGDPFRGSLIMEMN